MRLLVVDDNVDSADSIAMLLQVAGHEVRVAYSGHEALETASEYKPDVVLLDIGLPGMDGYEVAGRLRESSELKEKKLIAVTGYGQEADVFNLKQPVSIITWSNLLTHRNLKRSWSG